MNKLPSNNRMQSDAADDFQITIFSKYLELRGNCRYLPSNPVKMTFICLRDSKTYMVSFTDLNDSETPQSKLFISTEMAQEWHVTVLSQQSETIDGLVHLATTVVTDDGSIHSHEYSLCDESICVSFNSESISVYKDVVLQLANKLIENGE